MPAFMPSFASGGSLWGLRLLPVRALLRLGHPDSRKILLIGGANPVVQVPPAEFALGLQIADGRPEQRDDGIGNRSAGRSNRHTGQKTADGGGKESHDIS